MDHQRAEIVKLGLMEEGGECPADFRCPISMEVMKEPVTISTGITYERKNIEKWFFTYKKSTCPATMQCLQSFDITPNHTLNRLILSWQQIRLRLVISSNSSPSPSSSTSSLMKHDEMMSLLNTIDSSPFKVNSLKKLRSIVEMGDEAKSDFIKSGGLQVVIRILVQILNFFDNSSSDFTVTSRTCEEALAIVHQLPIFSDLDHHHDLLSKPESMKSIAIMLQRGSDEARLHAITIFRRMAKSTDRDNENNKWNLLIQDHQGVDFFKSLLELASDDQTKASSLALEVMIEILMTSSSLSPSKRKESRLRAIEAGAICVLIELLLDSSANRSKCEKMFQLMKLLCECAEGRLALVDHAMGIAAVTKKLLNVSNAATKIGVKIMWLITSFLPTDKVLEEMLNCGTVKKLLALLHMEGSSSTKDKVIKMFKLHANSWKRYPCFPCELKDYLGLVYN